MIKYVKKRDGRIVKFNKDKITAAIFKAAQAVGGKDKKLSERLAGQVVKLLEKEFDSRIPNVEDVQLLTLNGTASSIVLGANELPLTTSARININIQG